MGAAMTVAKKPTVNPNDRERVVSTDRYRSGQLVWIWRHRDWRRGVVLGASSTAVIARYHLDRERGGQSDTGTFTAPYVMARDEVLPPVDARGAGR
jgi:hypothetical protein